MNRLSTLVVRKEADSCIIAQHCVHAKTALSRLVGLLNHSELKDGHGLLLEPCNQVHTLFMNFAIDAVFLNSDNQIVAISEMKPWRISKLHFRASKVLELPYQSSKKLNLVLGEKLLVTPC